MVAGKSKTKAAAQALEIELPDPAITLRRGKWAPNTAPGTSQSQADRQFVVALARGLDVLGAFRMKDGPLGNGDLARRTELPAATVSRITHTLTRLGYLVFDQRSETYDLGPLALSLGLVALKRMNIREIARPLMQERANAANVNVGLGIRERLSMLYIETCEGQGLIGLRLVAGARVPIATSALGRAYAAALDASDRAALYDELEANYGGDWPAIREGLEQAREEIATRGFCTSIGDWQKEINGAAVPLVLPEGREIYAINLGGPAYQLTEQELVEVQGPALAAAIAQLRAKLMPRE